MTRHLPFEALGSFLVATALVLAPGGAMGSAPATVSTDEATQALGAHINLLDQHRDALEQRYGFAGAEATLDRAFVRAGVDASQRVRAKAWGRKLYVLWAVARPFFQRHRDALSATLLMCKEQGHALPGDLAWIGDRMARALAHADVLSATLEQIVDTWSQRALATQRLAAAKIRLSDSQRVLGQLRTTGKRDPLAALRGEVREAGGVLSACRATEAYLVQVLREDAGMTLLSALRPVGERTSYRIGKLDLPEALLPASPSTSAPGALAGTMLPAAHAAHQAPHLLRREEVVHTRVGEANEALSTLRGHLAAVTRSGDLPEVQALALQEKTELARIATVRKQMRDTPLDTDEGVTKARELADQVVAMGKALEPLRRELAQVRSDAHLAAWRERKGTELAIAEADLANLRRRHGQTLERLVDASEALVRAEVLGRRVAAARMLQRLVRVEGALTSMPDVRSVRVLAAGTEVFRADRPKVEDLRRWRSELADASAVVDGVMEADTRWRRSFVFHALSSARGRADAGLAEDKGTPAVLAGPLAALTKRMSLGRAMPGAHGKELSETLGALVEDVPVPARALRGLVVTAAERARERFAGADSGRAAAPGKPLPPTDSLAALRKVLGKVVDGRSTALLRTVRNSVRRLPSQAAGFPEDAGARREILTDDLIAFLHLGALRWIRGYVAPAADGLAHLVADIGNEVTPYETAHGFALSEALPFREGDAVEIAIEATQGETRQPGAILGGAVLVPVGAAYVGGLVRYGTPRLAQVEADDDGHVTLHVTPSGDPAAAPP